MKSLFAFFGFGQTQRLHAGQALVELLVAMGISAILLPALTAGFIASREGKAQGRQRQDAVALLAEAKEAIRIVRDSGWSAVATNGVFHPVIAGSTWALSPGAETVSGFTRTIVVSDVYRNATGAIVASGGLVDPSTKQVVMTVSWATPIPSNVSSTMYLSRFTNRIYVQTTEADFTAGTKTNVIVTNTDGGEVTMATGGGGHGGDWCAPNLNLQSLTFPQKTSTNAIYAVPGKAFVGIGDINNQGFGESFSKVDITQTYPPTATVSQNIYSSNPVYGDWGDDNNAFLAVDDTSKQVLILDITVSPFRTIGSFTPPTTARGNSVYVSGNTGYMTAGATLYNFDVTSRSGVRPIKDTDGVALQGTGVKVIVVGNYAFVANSSITNQLQIVDVSNPTDLKIVGQTTVNNQPATDVAVNPSGTRAYVVTKYASGQKTFFIIDTTTKSGNQPIIGSFDTQGMSPHGVAIATGNKVIVVGLGGQTYQVLNVVQESSPTRCDTGQVNIATGIYGIATVLQSNGDAYSYIITGDTGNNQNGQFRMILGGNGNQFTPSGIFESATFDATMSAAFNRFDPNAIIPNQTAITYQVSGADPVAGSCLGSAFTFIGPDGTSSTSFATGSAIPFSNTGNYKNPSRCFRYRAYFTSSSSAYAPIFTDMTVSYSP